MRGTKLGPPNMEPHMGGCQEYGPVCLFGYPKYSVPYYNRDPKRDCDFDDHPYVSL